jgi:hypothetical protein
LTEVNVRLAALLFVSCLGVASLPLLAQAYPSAAGGVAGGSSSSITEIAVHCGPNAHYVHGHRGKDHVYVKGHCVRDHHH